MDDLKRWLAGVVAKTVAKNVHEFADVVGASENFLSH